MFQYMVCKLFLSVADHRQIVWEACVHPATSTHAIKTRPAHSVTCHSDLFRSSFKKLHSFQRVMEQQNRIKERHAALAKELPISPRRAQLELALKEKRAELERMIKENQTRVKVSLWRTPLSRSFF